MDYKRDLRSHFTWLSMHSPWSDRLRHRLWSHDRRRDRNAIIIIIIIIIIIAAVVGSTAGEARDGHLID